MKKAKLKNLSVFITTAILFSVNAHSQIIYTDIIPDSTSTGNYNLDLNNDGITDFLIARTGSAGACLHSNSYIKISPQNGSKCLAQKRAAGDVINSSLSFSSAANQIMEQWMWVRTETGCALHTAGSWNNAVNGYLALQLIVSGNTYYGWACLNTAGASSFTILDYAYNSVPGQSVLAGETSCTIPAVTLSASGPLSFCAGDSVTLTANGTGYQYQWKKGGINITGAKSQTYVAKTAGTYKCKVTNSCGSKTSGTKTVTVPCRMSNENSFEALEQLSVYPNPATNSVTIKFPSEEAGEISIVNLFGQVVYSEKINSEQTQIDVSRFSAGMYVVRWSSGENNEMKRFSIIK